MRTSLKAIARGLQTFTGRDSWRLPKKSDVLIYDQSSVRHLAPFINTSDASVFDTSLYSLNIWALLRGLRFGRPCMQTYLYGYISLVRPRVIITLIDNSLPFYFINHKFPLIKTIAIQNGRRDNFGRKPNTGFLDLLQKDHGYGKPSISHYCMFGEAEITLLSQYIDANFIATGNIQNNSFPSAALTPRSRPVVSFVSSHPNLSHDLSLTARSLSTYAFLQEEEISYSKYFGIESRAAATIAKIALEKNCSFQVIGKRPTSTPQEKKFFDQDIHPTPYVFIPNDDSGSSYRILADSDLIVSVDSTIAYEMFGRGKRCLFISARAESIGRKFIAFNCFGSPLTLPNSGKYWTNTATNIDFETLFGFALTASAQEWDQETEELRSLLVYFDFGNTRLQGLFSTLGISR
jgi:surface carbohydrate biosynthesis protein